MRLGVVLFAIGMLAVVTVFVLFALGMENLPVWLSVAAGVITPLGLAIGLIGLVKEARKGSGAAPAAAAKTAAEKTETAKTTTGKTATEPTATGQKADSAAESG